MRRLPSPLPRDVQRVLIAGSSGAGKTTTARSLSRLLGIPHTELDALCHGPGWAIRPEFAADVAAMLATGRWITEYQYPSAKPQLLRAAQAVVWLDHPFPLVAVRIVRRSLVRALTRRPVHNGNVERFAMWARASHPLRIVLSPAFFRKRRSAGEELTSAAARGVVVVRLRGAREVHRWLAAHPAAETVAH